MVFNRNIEQWNWQLGFLTTYSSFIVIFNADKITKIYGRYVVITGKWFNFNELYRILPKNNKCLKSLSEDWKLLRLYEIVSSSSGHQLCETIEVQNVSAFSLPGSVAKSGYCFFFFITPRIIIVEIFIHCITLRDDDFQLLKIYGYWIA